MRPATPNLPGLDGLRALAVAAVLLFHGDLPGVAAGGFLGVDVFFTVSGFLITSLLLREFERSGTVAIGAFYLRRARRLLPALFAVLLACALVAPLWAPETVQRLREDLLAALVYVSNWWQIVSEQPYFETFGRPPLLQHLWSLAIEEQFYLLWPLLALAVLKLGGPRALKWLSGALALGVTAWMAHLAVLHGVPTEAGPNRLYLASDTHTMGLLAGAWLACAWNPWALIGRQTRPASLWTWDLLGLLGLVGLLASFAWVNEGMPGLYRGGFLGVSALTLLVLLAACDGRTLVSRLLELAPLRWLGRRSYGLYLWHWPVFVLLRPGEDLPADPWVALACRLLVTVVLTEACMALVENPVRRGRWPTRGLARWAPASAALALMVGGGWHLFVVAEPGPAEDAVGLAEPALSALNPAPATGRALTAIGDSVLLGAQGHLQRVIPGVQVDAEVGRQGSGGLRRIRELRASGALADTVLVHLGTNGYLYERQVEELLTELSDRERVIVMNVHAARRWVESNNRMLRRSVEGRPNVTLVDWSAMAQANPEFFVNDGVHLTSQGIRAYAEQVRRAGGFPARQVPLLLARREAPAANEAGQGGTLRELRPGAVTAPPLPVQAPSREAHPVAPVPAPAPVLAPLSPAEPSPGGSGGVQNG
jgi:peptidoglycan/LPS O-acetylase OafA/YrhL